MGHPDSYPILHPGRAPRAIGAGSEAVGPLLGGVEDAEDLDGAGMDAIGDDIGRVGDNEFAGAGDAACAAHGGIFAQQSDGAEDPLHDAISGGWVVLGNVVRFCFEIG